MSLRQPFEMVNSSRYMVDKINKRLIISSHNAGIYCETLVNNWLQNAKAHHLDKIWLWAFLKDVAGLLHRGFVLEGMIADHPAYKPVASLAYYLTPERSRSDYLTIEDAILRQVTARPGKGLKSLPPEFSFRVLQKNDCERAAKLLAQVFASYPTPVSDPAYIFDLMKGDCIFAGAFVEDKLVSTVAAYLDPEWHRAEMTDCATLEAYRGYSLTERLIRLVEPMVYAAGPYTPYTLARAGSLAMNRVFHKLGYQYQGRLINNCHIGGRFEDMNLWVKYQ